MIICTMTTASHLYRAKVMAKSVKKHHPEARVIVCLLETKLHPAGARSVYFDHVVLAKEMGVDHFDDLIRDRNIHETAFVLKGHFLQYLFRTYGDERDIIMLDTDVKVLSPFIEVYEALEKHPIILTPHELMDQKEIYMFHGIFNIGFIALRRNEETFRFLDWWTRRVDRYCYDRCYDLGLFYEQNWLNLAPAYFNVHILEHPGYNVAFWNLGERGRTIARVGPGQYTVNGVPIRFFHFSNLTGALLRTIKKEVPANQSDIRILYNFYLKELRCMGQAALSRVRWSYDEYKSRMK